MSFRTKLTSVALAVAAAAGTGCSSGNPPEDTAATAALAAWKCLASGQYEDYIALVDGTDSLPAAYREQLVANAKQFVAGVTKEHGGIDGVAVCRTVADSANCRANVFLLLCFGDSTREEILVPMTLRQQGWRVK